jgi:hypothetical protein
MKCTNCGKEITPGSAVTEDNYLFCNAICRFEWKSKGKPTPFASKRAGGEPVPPAVNELEFPLSPPGFENRNMRVRLSYLGSPKLFLDGELMKPVKSRALSPVREYSAVSNFGKKVSIRLRRRILDQIPAMNVGGQEFLIARPLTRWEYAWMALPALIFLLGGGLIGGAIGAAALLSNSVLMRRIQNPLTRYVLTGGTTAMAFMLFIRISTSFLALLNAAGLSPGGQTVEEQLVSAAAEINKKCPYMLDDETRADSLASGPGKSITYYYTLVKRSASQLDIPRLQEQLRPAVVQNVQTNPTMEPLRNLQVKFLYKYADKNGSPAFDLSVVPPDYR